MPAASATRGGARIMAKEPATFCPASVISPTPPVSVEASTVAAENIAAAPVLEPVTYAPSAPSAGARKANSSPVEAAARASSAAMPLAANSTPSSMNAVVDEAIGHQFTRVDLAWVGHWTDGTRNSHNDNSAVSGSHSAGLARN